MQNKIKADYDVQLDWVIKYAMVHWFSEMTATPTLTQCIHHTRYAKDLKWSRRAKLFMKDKASVRLNLIPIRPSSSFRGHPITSFPEINEPIHSEAN